MTPLKILGTTAGLAILIGTLSAQPLGGSKTAATVNGDVITEAEVKAVIDSRPPAPVVLSAEQQKAMQQGALEMLIEDVLMRQFLRRIAPAPNPAEINKEINELSDMLKKQSPPRTLEQMLREGKQTEAQLRSDITARLQWKAYLAAQVPEAKVKEYYDANKVFFDKVLVRASHILVKVAPNASAQDRQTAQSKIQAIRQEIMSGKIDFADAARRYSDCPSKEKWGDLGPFPYKFVVVEPFARAAFTQKKDEVGNVIATDFGYHIVKVTDRTAGEPSNYEAVRETAREIYAQEAELYPRILAEQKKTAKIEIFLK